MTDKDQLHYLLGYLEGLKTKDTIYPGDLEIVLAAIEHNSFFHEPSYEAGSDDNGDDSDDGDFDNSGNDDHDYDHSNRESFGQYAGSYAQDIEGLSDDFINDVLEGDPDNYWNID